MTRAAARLGVMSGYDEARALGGRVAVLALGIAGAFGVIPPVAIPLDAQTVEAVVVDDDGGRPVARARVTLIAAGGAVVDSAVTDAEGRSTVTAPGPGTYYLTVVPEGYLSMTERVVVEPGSTTRHRMRLPLRSTAAARLMNQAINREASFQLPLAELCGEELRPWEAGVLVGVVRDRATMEAVPGALVQLHPGVADTVDSTTTPAPEPDPAAPPDTHRSRRATDSGAYWFCNVPQGESRVVALADGFTAGIFDATVRAGTIAWYDALLRREGKGEKTP